MDQPSSTESNAITLRIKFRSASLDEFIARYGVDVSPGGIFIRTKQPVEVGTSLQFDFLLADGSPLLAGLGTVAWVRENDPSRTNSVPGMGLRFDKLTPDSQHTHQMILAEKARLEGRVSTTPYPATAFVVPAARTSPAPDAARPVGEAPAAPQPPPVNLAVTLPAPASAFPARMDSSDGDTDEFESGGKTEISDKPIDYYMREAEAAAEAAREAAALSAEAAAPIGPLDGSTTDSHYLDGSGAPPAPDEVAVLDVNAAFEQEPLPEPPMSASGERRVTGKQAFAALLDLGDSAESLDESAVVPIDAAPLSASGVPIEEAVSEKTEEVSLYPDRLATDAAAPVDLEAPLPDSAFTESPPSLDPLRPARKSRRPAKLMVAVVLLAGAAAFAAVYLIQEKPWEKWGGGESAPIVVVKRPQVSPVPAPAPAASEPAKSAAAEPAKPAAAPAAVVPAAAEPAKPAAAEPAKPTAAEESAAKKAAEEEEKAAAAAKLAAEKLAAAKVAPEAPTAKSVAKPAGKTAAKPAVEKGAVQPAVAEKVSTPPGEEIYRLALRSIPIGAEVLIDGEYFARTPCERRILDPKRTISIVIRREGYEPHERMIGSSDNWVMKDNEHILTITVTLKKSAKPSGSVGVAPATGSTEVKPAPKPEAASAAKVEPKAEPAKTAPATQPAPTPKSTPFKAAPDEPYKE
jgi:molecular chaperone DnaK